MVWPILSFQTAVFFKGRNSWTHILFYFFFKHRLKTLNKEKYDLTNIVLVVTLQIFVKNTSLTLHFPIWCILSMKEIYQALIWAYNLLLLQNFSIMDDTVWPISSFQNKIDQTAFELRCTFKTFIQKLHILNHTFERH